MRNTEMSARRLAIAVIGLLLVILIGKKIFGSTDAAPHTTPTPTATLTTTPPAIPSGWQTFPASDFGFTFSYPASWQVDDATINQFYTLHQAFLSYANQMTVSSSQTAENDHTVGSSLAITIASASDTASRLGTSFSSSADWLNKSSQGLPPKSVITPLTIDGKPAVELSNLTTPFGNYKVIYFYDVAHKATVRFDCYYTGSSSTDDTIVQSFRFTTTFTNG